MYACMSVCIHVATTYARACVFERPYKDPPLGLPQTLTMGSPTTPLYYPP